MSSTSTSRAEGASTAVCLWAWCGGVQWEEHPCEADTQTDGRVAFKAGLPLPEPGRSSAGAEQSRGKQRKRSSSYPTVSAGLPRLDVPHPALPCLDLCLAFTFAKEESEGKGNETKQREAGMGRARTLPHLMYCTVLYRARKQPVRRPPRPRLRPAARHGMVRYRIVWYDAVRCGAVLVLVLSLLHGWDVCGGSAASCFVLWSTYGTIL